MPDTSARLQTVPSTGVRLDGIEGMRALAALSIVAVHVWGFSTPGGPLGGAIVGDAISTLAVGVTLFFTLSGFLLYRPFAASIARGVPHMPIRAYLRNRVLRIAPAYWVILIATALVFAAANVMDAVLLRWREPSVSGGGAGRGRTGAEELAGHRHWPPGRWPWKPSFTACCHCSSSARRTRHDSWQIAAAVFCCSLHRSCCCSSGCPASTSPATSCPRLPPPATTPTGTRWSSGSFWAQADLFTFGMVVAVLYTEVLDGRFELPRFWRPAALMLAIGIFVPCAVTMHRGEHSYLLQNTGEALAIALALAAVMLPSPTERPLRAVRALETRPLVTAGVISYSLFLWHQPIVVWLETHRLTFGGWPGLIVNTIVVLTIAVLFSAATYRLVELPALRRKRSTKRDDATPRVDTPRIDEPARVPALALGSEA